MAGSATNYWAQLVLDACLGQGNLSVPSNYYLALSTAAFDTTATGSSMNEVSAGGYARIEVTNDSSTWSAPSNASPSASSNLNDLVWPTATADWGTPASVYLCDSSSGGNVFYGADLSNSADVANGSVFKILAGSLTFNGS